MEAKIIEALESTLSDKFTGPLYTAQAKYISTSDKGSIFEISYINLNNGNPEPGFTGRILYGNNGATSVL